MLHSRLRIRRGSSRPRRLRRRSATDRGGESGAGHRREKPGATRSGVCLVVDDRLPCTGVWGGASHALHFSSARASDLGEVVKRSGPFRWLGRVCQLEVVRGRFVTEGRVAFASAWIAAPRLCACADGPPCDILSHR